MEATLAAEHAAHIALIPEDVIVSPFKQRFSAAPWFERLKSTHILLIGAGGIGSWVAFCLSRIGCDYTIFDMDIVESHNLGGQLYSLSHVGMNKAVAMQLLAGEFSGYENSVSCDGRYTEQSISNEIVIAAFDNMAGRKIAFENWVALMQDDKGNEKNYLFVDGRLLAEQYQVYAVTCDPKSIERYRATLFEDSAIPDTMCTLKSTTHCSMGVASDIIGVLTNFATNRTYGVDAREVPFCIEKSIDLFTYNVES